MYKDGWISYNSDDLSKAISEAKKVSNIAGFFSSKYSGIQELIPQNFKLSGELLTVLRNVTNGGLSSSNSNEILNFLTTTKEELDQYVEENIISEELMNYGFNFTEINGTSGYLYVPDSYSSTSNLPLITWFSGSGQSGKDVIKKFALPKLIDNGYKMDAVVWCPCSYTTSSHEKQVDTIKSIVDNYNLDENRVSLFGYSLGAETAYFLAKENPNYFSSVVTFGTCFEYKDIKSPDTTFIMYQGGMDQFGDANATYNQLKQNGNQVILYKLASVEHKDVDIMFTDKIFMDAISIKKGDKFSNIPNDIINVETTYENGNRFISDENYYVKLNKDNISSSVSFENDKELVK